MIGLVAFVPQPPLLVPELVGGAVPLTRPLRDACLAAAGELATGANRWIAVGADASGPTRVPATAAGSFAGFGVDVPVSLGPHPEPGGELPLPLLIAGWLRSAAGRRTGAAAGLTEVTGQLVHPSAGPAECLAAGRALATELAGTADPVGLLVLGDGAATHPYPGAGRVDDRAGPYDDAIRHALAGADLDALAGLAPELADELGVTGRPCWQFAAGAARHWPGGGSDWRGELLYSAAPYGIGYHVAVWRAAPA